MLKFVNKDGKKVLEMKDNGDFSEVSEELKQQGIVEEDKEEDKDKDKEDNNDKDK